MAAARRKSYYKRHALNKQRNREDQRDRRAERLWVLSERQKGLCAWCREPLPPQPSPPFSYEVEIDHIVPKAAGGGNGIDNLQLVHIACNREKADKRVDVAEQPTLFGCRASTWVSKTGRPRVIG